MNQSGTFKVKIRLTIKKSLKFNRWRRGIMKKKRLIGAFILQAGIPVGQFPPIMDTHYALPVMKRAEELGIIDLKEHPMETWSKILSTEEKSAIGMSAPFSAGCAPKLIEGTVYVPSDYFSMFAHWTISDSTINFMSKNKEQ